MRWARRSFGGPAASALGVVALAALLPGCGSGGSSSAATAATGTQRAASAHVPPAARMSKAQALAYAHAVNLRAANVPGTHAGGVEREHHGSGDVARCIGLDRPGNVMEVHSPSFESKEPGEYLGVESEVTVLPSAAAAARVVAAFHSHRTQACIGRIVEHSLSKLNRSRVHLGKPSFTWTFANIPGTEGSYAARFILPITSVKTGISSAYYIDVLGFVSGPAVVELLVASIPQPYSSASEERLLSLLLSRAKAQ